MTNHLELRAKLAAIADPLAQARFAREQSTLSGGMRAEEASPVIIDGRQSLARKL
jgi:hypothetical protein